MLERENGVTAQDVEKEGSRGRVRSVSGMILVGERC